MFQDLRYGFRMALKNPGFTALVVLTLALGIGANAALFSVASGVLLSPLPYPEADRLVTIHQSKPNFDTGAMPYPNFLDVQKNNRTFTSMAISRGFGFSLIGIGEPERLVGRVVSADFFSVLQIQPALGRTFASDEDASPTPVIVISHALWQRKFESSSNVIGRTVPLNNKTYTVVGVLPAKFNLYADVDVYGLIGQWNSPALKNRSAALGLHGIGRMKPGMSIEQAQADLSRVMADLARAYPDANTGHDARIVGLRERIVGDVATTLWVLLGAVGFVLLIACLNVSNLLLARSTGRTREFAIRSALGAGRWRLLRQTLTESMLLSLTGGALGLILAGWGTQLALSQLPTALPRSAEVRLDARVLFFTVLVSVLTGLVSGLIPALKVSAGKLSETLKETGRWASGGRSRAQAVLVAAEIALALVLLIGAGLMIRTLRALWSVDPGFRPENVMTFGLYLPPSLRESSPTALRTALRDLSDQISAAPGVEAASFSEGALPILNEDDLSFWLDSKPKPATQSEMNMAVVYSVEPKYLATMGVALKSGRFFTNEDDERAPRVVVIDEALANKYFPGQYAIGQRLRFGDAEASQIVGVVGHVKQWGIDSDERQSLQAQVYFSMRALDDDQVRGASNVSVVVRTDGRTSGVFDAIRRVVSSRFPDAVISKPQTMEDAIADSLASQRFSLTLLNSFALAALLLASIGLYGVISYVVGQRRQEFGVRIALGAQRGDMLSLIVKYGMKMAVAGVAAGVVGAMLLTRLLTGLLYGVTATDPLTFVVISLLLMGVALGACLAPAWRATRVDPLTALRHE